MEKIKGTIIEGATELFVKKGCKAITMDDIARFLGISKRTIYENYKDKEELLRYCLENLFKEIDIEVNSWLESENFILSFLESKDSANNVLQKLNKDFFVELKRYYPQVFKGVVECTANSHREKTLLFLEKGIREGYFLSTLNNNLITLVIQEMGQALGNEEVFSPRLYTADDIFKNGFVPYLRGICTAKGIETINRYYNLH